MTTKDKKQNQKKTDLQKIEIHELEESTLKLPVLPSDS